MVKTLVADRLRQRLLPEPEQLVPAFPERGLSDDKALVRRYRLGDAAVRLELEHSSGMDLWRSPDATAMTDEEQATRWCRSQQRSVDERTLPASFAIESLIDHAYIGDFLLKPVPHAFATVEFGAALLPSARGHAVGSRAARLFFDWIFDGGDIRRLEAVHVVGNRPACIGSLAVGLAKEGVKRGAFPTVDESGSTQWRDLCCHALVIGDPRR